MTPAFDWSKDDVQTIKAAWASEHKHALLLIVERLGNLHGGPHSLSHEDLAFDAGRKFVARELTIAINTPLDKFVKDQNERANRTLTATERADRASAEHYRRTVE